MQPNSFYIELSWRLSILLEFDITSYKNDINKWLLSWYVDCSKNFMKDYTTLESTSCWLNFCYLFSYDIL